MSKYSEAYAAGYNKAIEDSLNSLRSLNGGWSSDDILECMNVVYKLSKDNDHKVGTTDSISKLKKEGE